MRVAADRNARLLLSAAAAVVLLSACGPTHTLQVAVKPFPVPIPLEQIKGPSPAPSPSPVAVPVIPLGPGLTLGPAPAPSPSPSAVAPTPIPSPVVQCPDLSPFAVPARPAAEDIIGNAPAGHYTFRHSGTINGKAPLLTVIRTVTDTSAQGATTPTFDVSNEGDDDTLTQSYSSTNTTAGPVVSGELDLTGVKRGSSPATVVPPLKLFQTPADTGVNWRSAATDSSGTSYTLQATINGKKTLNACGTAVQAWEVAASEQVVGPTDNLTYDLLYYVASGYGGLIVGETRKSSGGTRNGAAYSIDLTTTISTAQPS